MMDFEKAHMNCVRNHFPNVSISVCLFHLSQSIYRKVIELGFKERYHRDAEFSVKVRSFSALALLPMDDVVDAFDELTDDVDFPQELVSYFEACYIGCKRGRGNRRRRIETSFFFFFFFPPIHIWNVRKRNLQDQPRTTNNLEGYHYALQSVVSGVHPNIWKLISTLKKEESLAQLKKKLSLKVVISFQLRGSTWT